MATAKKGLALSALFVGALGLVVITQIAGATHPHPAGASPLRVSLVPAYQPCTASNRTHGPPLAYPSCNPPVLGSKFLTVGTPDANGAPAKSQGFVKIAVRTNPGPPPQSMIVITSRVTDVRCKAGTSTCGNDNTTGGADYTGELQANATIRVTDHYNATSPGGGSDPATLVDIAFPVNLPCTSTSDPSVGGLCDVAFSPQPLSPIPNDTWFNGKRVVIEMTQFEVIDGGSDGVVSTTPNTLFMKQGIFIP